MKPNKPFLPTKAFVGQRVRFVVWSKRAAKYIECAKGTFAGMARGRNGLTLDHTALVTVTSFDQNAARSLGFRLLERNISRGPVRVSTSNLMLDEEA
jgi:hypothetical protein